MTEIDFHFNVPDKLAYSCRLLRKACLSGARVAVIAEAPVLAELDALLWRFSAVEFVPHCTPAASACTLAATPLVLTGSLVDYPHRDVLVNLGQGVPAGFEGFKRLIEVVSMAPEDAGPGRKRWTHYKARGYDLKRHDQAGAAGSG
ncbi:MAG: polymerase chi subunit [Polaromonas sp.]|nr:polymerase chi subunit [Polaromonas sp.]